MRKGVHYQNLSRRRMLSIRLPTESFAIRSCARDRLRGWSIIVSRYGRGSSNADETCEDGCGYRRREHVAR